MYIVYARVYVYIVYIHYIFLYRVPTHIRIPASPRPTTFPNMFRLPPSGVAVAAKGLRPSLLVIGAEPELANDACRSFTEGQRRQNDGYPETIAGTIVISSINPHKGGCVGLICNFESCA